MQVKSQPVLCLRYVRSLQAAIYGFMLQQIPVSCDNIAAGAEGVPPHHRNIRNSE